jgi:hypothetical protein
MHGLGWVRFASRAVLMAALAALQACGGGGGGVTQSTTPVNPINPVGVAGSPCLPVPGAVSLAGNSSGSPATVVVKGTATFSSVPNNAATDALDYNAASCQPIRGATVQAVSGSGVILASTSTSGQGTYSFVLPINTTYSVRVRAELINATGPATWNVSVKNNTAGNALWVIDSTASFTGATDSVRSISAPSGWNGTSYEASRPAAFFAILDTIYSGMQLVRSAKPSIAFPTLTVYWSPDNNPAAGDESLGEIGTSNFVAEISGADVIRSMYILGKQDVDTDEYDSGVVAHEYGHYLQSAFSTTGHSPGGPHGASDKSDMTLAFSEGWGNAWSSMARNNPRYSDSSGSGQSFGGGFDANVQSADPGWYREDSVQSSLYQLFKEQGFTPIWTALSGPMKSQDALASIFSFAAAVRSAGNQAVTTALNNILFDQNIFTGSIADQWGAGETNDGGHPGNLPIYNPLAFNTPTSACFIETNVQPGDPWPNKLGALKYFRINLSAAQAGERIITANFPVGRDVDFDVFQNGVLLLRALSGEPSSEVATINLSAGEVIIRASDANQTAPVTPCATLTIQ